MKKSFKIGLYILTAICLIGSIAFFYFDKIGNGIWWAMLFGFNTYNCYRVQKL